jgi:hypothetical protein
MKLDMFAAASGIALSAFLLVSPATAQGARVDAEGKPTTDSTPAEKADTARINAQEGVTTVGPGVAATAQSDANNAQYQAQQQQYQQALQDNQAAQQKYQDRSAAYLALRERYAAERAAYHRGIWPDRYVKWVIVERDANLVGERVELISGNRVGTVIDTAHAPNGNVSALLVRLDSDKIVWIDSADVRYNRADGIVMTNLQAADLHHMADERL